MPVRTVWLLTLLLGLTDIVKGQIGVTTCTFATQALCAANIPLSYCDVGAGRCKCATVAGYVDDGTGFACTYECGALTSPTNGGVSTAQGTNTGDIATYSCNNGYKLVGSSTRTCVQDTGWNGAAPTCTQGVIGDSCASNTNLCILITFGTCAASTCQCLPGYENDGTNTKCKEINECVTLTPCTNGGTCTDGINSYTCACVAGYTGTNCSTNINECASAPCQNGGTCNDGINSYTCTCAAGYTGTTCATNINECSSTPCQNGGSCTDLVNGYTCTCVAGYTGTTCATNINECASNPCQNGGTCTDLVNNYSCACVAGYTDKNCQTNINECIGNLCQNGATCVDGINQYTCNCVAGYNGTLCSNNINDCAVHNCSNGATCVDGVNKFTCTCAPGFNGTYCTNNIDECVPVPCVNGGTCIDGINDYTCNCVAGYTGKTCATNINECASSPCQNGGTCTDLINNYSCACVAGYTDKNCQTNINECASSPCQNGGTCTDLINNYACSCVAGYTDKNCQTNINECIGNVCQNGATCVDQINQYACLCVAGYNGTFCNNNINECVGHSCQNGGACVDGINTYSCVCAPGYNGTFCTNNINECIPLPCVNGGSCVDGVNDYTCNCVAGYSGKNCATNINECSSAPCQNGGTCVDAVNNYTCNCLPGYTDKNCQTNIDECVTNNCKNGATCVDGINGYSCVCAQGYNGVFCTNNINECVGNVCQNGAYCLDKVNGYTCECLLGYDGTFCQNNINECANHTCQNGATCVDGINGYSCTCMPGYNGNLCQLNINECASHGCVNGATCVDEINKYTCTCVAGYTGTLCSTNINECSSSPCKNGGTCVDAVNDYSCNCVAGYTDKNCQTNINECASAPCQNNGTCVDAVNDYSCLCVDGYTGKNCATNINECSSDPCQNGATCTDLVNGYTCTCIAGYNGVRCQTNINECLSHSCVNGATCVDGINKYTCTCVTGYDGTYCQNNINECATHNCKNGATCVDGINAYTCICVSGYTDTYCGTNINECASNPCLNGGTCTDNVNGYTCSCANGFTGLTCRPGVLGDSCSPRPVVCNNLAYANCNGSICVCNTGYQDAGATGSCSRINCGSITPPVNGAVNHSEGTLYESKAYFSCNAGYTLNGLSSVTCQADKTWNGATPICVIKDCGTLSAPLNGAVAFTPNTLYLGSAEFSCNVGYNLNGSATRTCQSSGVWGGSSPVCKIKDCGSINPPSNGAVDQTDGTTYLSVVTFRCNTGYTLVGSSSLKCQADATWDAAKPSCNVKDCGFLTAPVNGLLNQSQGTEYLATAFFYCNTGYTLVGSYTRICQASGVWSTVSPVCQINDCGVLSDPTNGDVNINDGTTYGKVATYSCNPGFALQGVTQRTCQANKVWSSTAPTCARLNCGTLNAPTNGLVDLSAGTLFEATATFQCNPGYTLTGSTTRDCTTAGTWDNASPTCVIKDCGILTSPVYGYVLTQFGTKYNATAVYSCIMGYEVNGVSSRVCQTDGIWSASNPTCVIKDCGPVALITNGDISYSNGTVYGSTVSYTCDDGYEVTGVSTRVCLSTGVWDDVQPLCTILSCDDAIVIPHGVARTPSGSQVGDLAIYECISGYGLVGNPNVECKPSGFWGTVPECRLDCGNPPTVAHGSYTYANGTLVGAGAVYTCDSGYYISGQATVTCQSFGAWSTEPSCLIILIDYNTTCTVTAQCKTTGATCRDDGHGADRCLCSLLTQHFDPVTDECLAVCGGLPAPTNGKIALPSVYAAGQSAVYTCDRGYSLTGPATRTCLPAGYWNSSAPQCTTGCPYPTAPKNGHVDASRGTASGNTITYSCNDGYALIGAAQRRCNSDAKWNGHEPVCKIECPKLLDIENGKVDLSLGTFEGSKAVYVCKTTYAIVGESTRTCQSSGVWDGVQPSCVFAIFPDVILVFGSLFVFLVLIDVFVLGFCVYIRYFQKKPDMPSADIDEPQKDLKKEKRKKKDYPDTLNDEEKGVPPSSHRHSSKEHRDRKEKEKQERRTRAANRTVPDTRQEILPTDHHPPPQNGPNVRIERNPYLGFDKPKFLKSLTKSRSKPPTKENDYGLDLTELTKVEDMQFTSLDTPQAPPSSEQRANKGFGEETADHVHLDELVKDGGYGTANSDESNARIHFDDRLSLEDLTPAGPVPDPPVITLKETKKPTDEFTDTFKGRTDLRPMSARVEAERDGEKPHTTRDRRHLMNLLNTDSEI